MSYNPFLLLGYREIGANDVIACLDCGSSSAAHLWEINYAGILGLMTAHYKQYVACCPKCGFEYENGEAIKEQWCAEAIVEALEGE